VEGRESRVECRDYVGREGLGEEVRWVEREDGGREEGGRKEGREG